MKRHLILVAFAVLPTAALAQEERESFPLEFAEAPTPLFIFPSLTGRVLQGDYGGDRTLATFQMISGLGVAYGRFDFSVTQYFVSTDSVDTQVSSFGFVYGSSTTRESGLGDTYVGVGVVVLSEEDLPVQLHLSTSVKIPTAAEELGTGEADVSAFLTASRTLEQWLLLGRIGYTVMGDSDTTDYDNAFSGAVSFGRRFAVEEPIRYFDLRLWLRGQTAVLSTSEDSIEVALTGDYPLSETFLLNAEVARGLTDGAPDWTIGLGFRLNLRS